MRFLVRPIAKRAPGVGHVYRVCPIWADGTKHKNNRKNRVAHQPHLLKPTTCRWRASGQTVGFCGSREAASGQSIGFCGSRGVSWPWPGPARVLLAKPRPGSATLGPARPGSTRLDSAPPGSSSTRPGARFVAIFDRSDVGRQGWGRFEKR